MSILTRPAEAGGVFEYCPNIRSVGSENLADVRAVLTGRADERHGVRGDPLLDQRPLPRRHDDVHDDPRPLDGTDRHQQERRAPVQFDAIDATGKVSLDHLYEQDDPRPYYATLRRLGYVIPQLAKPYFAKLIEECRDARSVAVPTVVDLGCSYGVNAALLRCDVTIDELYERYAGSAGAAQGRDELVTRDRDLIRTRCQPGLARFVGLDSSAPALSYAVEAGLLDAAVHADLERDEATSLQRSQLAEADLVISTGCVGYVSERTIRQIADAATRAGRPLPWMAHFVLRMFPYATVADSLSELGYDTVKLGGVLEQRRFASAREQSAVLDRLRSAGVDPEGLEANGSLYAELHLSLPSDARTASRLAPRPCGWSRPPRCGSST